MKIRHLNCISACPLGGALMDGQSWLSIRGRLTCHCLLVEADAGLTLIDTGYGLRDIATPGDRLHWFFLTMLRPDFREEMTAVRQIQALGYNASDVRHIVLSHLDFDHAGGLDDFPEASIHLLAPERDAAIAQATLLDRMRYRPQQWSSRNRWQVYPLNAGEKWYGFDHVQACKGLSAEVLLVPLAGHTLGHAGIAALGDKGWLLYAGDAYFYHGEMDHVHPHCTPGLRFYQWLMEKDRSARLQNQARLRSLHRDHGDEVCIFCAHDTREFSHMAQRTSSQPIAPAVPLARDFAARSR